jgi:PhnB protein
MRIRCHLSFDGQCEVAFRTYQRIVGGQITMMLEYGESPMADQVPAQWQSRILHATLELGDQELLGFDAFPDAYERPQGFSVTLGISEPATAKEVFLALAEGGRVQMPYQETFWSPGFGVLIDRFGVPWEVNCERPAGST